MFFDHLRHLLIFEDLLIKVSIIEKIHHEAEAGCLILKKCLFVTDNARVPIFKLLGYQFTFKKTNLSKRLKVVLVPF